MILALLLFVSGSPLLAGASATDSNREHTIGRPDSSTPAGTEPKVSLRFSTFFNPKPYAQYTELWEARFDMDGNIIVAGIGDYLDPRAAGSPYAGIQTRVYDADARLDESSVMVAKLTPDGVPVWLVFMDGSGLEKEVDGLGVDSEGNVVISGTTPNKDFPVTPGAFDVTINSNGRVNIDSDVFVAKISADGTRLIFSTFLGGSDGLSTSRGGLAVAGDDSIYVVGQTFASNFLRKPSSGIGVPVRNEFNGGVADGFLLRLSADGSSVDWVTYIGSAKERKYGDVVVAVATGPDDKPHVTALVRGDDLPTTAGVFSRQYAGGETDGYAARFDTSGNLEWATYIGGSGEDGPGHGLRVDREGSMIFAGSTYSSDWPVRNAYQPVYGGAGDGHLTKLDSTGRLVFSTFIGGAGEDGSEGVGLIGDRWIAIGGNTNSNDFQVTANAIDPTYNGGGDVFGRVYDASGVLVYSTYAGGSDFDRCRYGTSTPDGDMVLVGITLSADYPVSSNAFKTKHNGRFDTYITRYAINKQ